MNISLGASKELKDLYPENAEKTNGNPNAVISMILSTYLYW
jgi:hypothetical protein